MKTRFLILFAVLGLMILVTSIPDVKALRVIYTVEQMAEHADVIAIGTIESTWVDIRPFADDHKIVDTATIRVDEWLKDKEDSSGKTLQIRYYGYWAKAVDELFGVFRFDTPVHSYDTGQKILALTTYEEPTMVMGEGYYPFFEGVFVIKDDVAIQQTEDPPISLEHLRQTITSSLGETPNNIQSLRR